MSKIIYDKFDKKSITKLPKVEFQGKIQVVITEKETERAVDFLLSCDLLGVDTETRPSFKKGKQNVVALLQVANDDICFLFRLNLLGLSKPIIRFLEDTTVPKVGLSLHDDMLSLSKRGDFIPGNFIDLQDHMTELGIQDLSLQKLFANIFHQKISKAQQRMLRYPWPGNGRGSPHGSRGREDTQAQHRKPSYFRIQGSKRAP